MEALSSRSKRRSVAQQHAVYDYCFDSVATEELLELFPLPRYFQIHFNHVHENTDRVKQQCEELEQQVRRIEDKLDRILDVLSQK